MLISVGELVDAWSIQPTGVIHIGAHMAEESASYQTHNWGPVTWIEANPNLIDALRFAVPIEDTVICAALWDQNDLTMDFNIASNGESSSLLAPAEHLSDFPAIHFDQIVSLRTKRLDAIISKIPNFINLDVQGAELKVLEGLGELIHQLDFVYTEFNDTELYVDCARLSDLECFLKTHGFRRICLRRSGLDNFGDALYARNELNLNQNMVVNMTTFWRFLKSIIDVSLKTLLSTTKSLFTK